MNKSNWTKNMKTQEDIANHAEKLLRRMKRDYTFSLSTGNGHLMAGYRTYVLNGEFITKDEAKEILIKELNATIKELNSKKEILYKRTEVPHYIFDSIEIQYTTTINFGDFEIEYKIHGQSPEEKCKNWKLTETKIRYGQEVSRKEIGGFWIKYKKEDFEKIIQAEYDEYHKDMIACFN